MADDGRRVPAVPPVRRLLGAREIAAALDAGTSIGCILVTRAGLSTAARAVVERARAAGVPVRRESPSEMRRMSPPGTRCEALGLAGREPEASLDTLLSGDGAVWLFARPDYPSNLGGAIRTVEVGGADGVVVDCAFGAREKETACRISMHAERFLPVLWAPAATVLDACPARRRVIAVEDTGTVAPWDVDLRGPILLVAGSERLGVPTALLARCPEVIRIPMAGFIPAYNLQAAVAVVTGERLRQLTPQPTPRG